MAEYTKYCDEETSEKTYAMQTADRTMAALEATIEDVDAQVAGLGDEIKTLGTEISSKDSDLTAATMVRTKEKTDFSATEKELMESVDQLERAIVMIKRGTAFVQSDKHKVDPDKAMKAAMSVFSEILDAGRVSAGLRRKLQNLVQTSGKNGEDEYEKLGQPQAKTEAYSSSSGGILGELTSMKEKAEETLSETRMAEMKQQHNFQMFAQGLTDAIKIANERLADSKKTAASLTEESGKAKAELVATKQTKSADEAFLAALTSDCKEAAAGWEERQESAQGELAAINKATEILSEGVKVFMLQTKKGDPDFEGDDAAPQTPEDAKRQRLVQKLKSMSSKFSSYALMEVAGAAATDPFAKVKGLIEGMIAKLVTEANEQATQKGFCDEETSKSTAAKEEKSMTIDELSSRMEKASATKGLLEQKVKTLESEIAALDKGTVEATKIRNEEKATYLKASSDFKLASAAVEKAIKVLKEYYASALIQTSAVKSSGKKQPDFGAPKSDAAHSIISILEMSGENFTKLLMETETDESEAQTTYESLMQDNKISKVAKSAEIKGALSEIKSLDVALKNHKEDYDMTSKELAAVMEYLDKLKPQCETKAMSYGEKKARREAEIEGLKEALGILEGGALLEVSVQRHLRH